MTNRTDDEWEWLIEAAPAILAALKDILIYQQEQLQNSDHVDEALAPLMEAARAAVAKAEGTS